MELKYQPIYKCVHKALCINYSTGDRSMLLCHVTLKCAHVIMKERNKDSRILRNALII